MGSGASSTRRSPGSIAFSRGGTISRGAATGQDIESALAAGAALLARPQPRRRRRRARGACGRARRSSTSAAAARERVARSGSTSRCPNACRRRAIAELATGYDRKLEVVVEPERARFSTWYELFPRSTYDSADGHGTFKQVEAQLSYIAQMGFDVVYLPPIHPIGRTNRKGANNALAARPRRPRLALGHRRERRRARRDPSESRDDRRLPQPRRGGEEARNRGRSRHRVSMLARPSLCAGASRVVPPPARRHDPIRRESAEEVRGHLSVRLRDERLAGALAASSKSVVEFWIDQGVKIFRVDNPHTKPFAFWEWLIGRVKAAPPRGDLSLRGVHAAEGHASAREARLHAVVYLLHLAQYEGGADRVRDRAYALPSRANTSGPTSGPTRPISCTNICSSAAGRRSWPGSFSPRRWVPTTASTARRSSCSKRRRASRGPRSI